MKILFSGGGTAGSVMPLLSLYHELKIRNPETKFAFIGTKRGVPEIELLRGYSVEYHTIWSGKFRRYFDLKNVSDLFLTLYGFLQSLFLIGKIKPDIIVGTGGYVSVPVIWAGWVMRKKILIHQQDIQPSLSNILCLNLANTITVTFEISLRNFPSGKTIWTGNPVRYDIFLGSRDQCLQRFGFKKNVPLLLVLGGGTGAQSINTVVNQSLSELIKLVQVLHITGQGKKVSGNNSERYRQIEFIGDGMNDALAAADIVLSRAGLSTLTELVALHKPAIIVPLPKSHQEKNADYFRNKNAAIVIPQHTMTPTVLIDKIAQLVHDKHAIEIITANIARMMKKNGTTLIADELLRLV